MTSATPDRGVEAWLGEHLDGLVAFRRNMHAHPELSGEEHATTELVRERLAVAGLDSRTLSSGTGLVCDLDPDDAERSGGERLALRADLDALAMDDETTTPYRSQQPGVAHACGHDVHTTIALGTALYYAAHRDELPGRLRFIFQPAEERVPGGALDVITDGGLDDVGTIIGLHCDPKLDVGSIGLKSGAISSAADMATITLTGPGGHTARPEQTVDLVTVMGRIVAELPIRVAESLDDPDQVKLVFGAIHAGGAANVIPSHGTLSASVRTPSLEVWETLPDLVDALLRDLLRDTGAEYDLDYVHGVPPVVNHPSPVDVIDRAARRELGDEAITPAVQSWGGDDFAWYTRERAGAYVRLGVHDPSSNGLRLDLHAGHFDVDERSIPVGVRLLAAAIREHFAASTATADASAAGIT
ncbi:MAG: amidohydrolase [Actinomycetota bacterium]